MSPGLAFASAMNSASVAARTLGCTMTPFATWFTRATDAKSFRGSKAMPLYRNWLMLAVPIVAISRVWPFGQHPRGRVGGAACQERDDQPDRLAGPGRLRPEHGGRREQRQGAEDGAAMQGHGTSRGSGRQRTPF